MSDLISRQSAIDAMNEVYCHIEMIKKRPVNKTEQAVYRDMMGAVKSVPSAQSDLIRCKDCKHYMTTGAFGTPLRKEDYWCDAENFPDEGQKELPEWWFCAGAERKDAT